MKYERLLYVWYYEIGFKRCRVDAVLFDLMRDVMDVLPLTAGYSSKFAKEEQHLMHRLTFFLTRQSELKLFKSHTCGRSMFVGSLLCHCHSMTSNWLGDSYCFDITIQGPVVRLSSGE